MAFSHKAQVQTDGLGELVHGVMSQGFPSHLVLTDGADMFYDGFLAGCVVPEDLIFYRQNREAQKIVSYLGPEVINPFGIADAV